MKAYGALNGKKVSIGDCGHACDCGRTSAGRAHSKALKKSARAAGKAEIRNLSE